MLRTMRALIQRTATDMGRAAHLTRHDATSPAVKNVEKPNCAGLRSIKTETNTPTKVANIAAPLAHAKLARPKDGNSCSALAKGGPTARAPHVGQPRQRSPLTVEPQEGQISKLLTSGEKQKSGTKLELPRPVSQDFLVDKIFLISSRTTPVNLPCAPKSVRASLLLLGQLPWQGARSDYFELHSY